MALQAGWSVHGDLLAVAGCWLICMGSNPAQAVRHGSEQQMQQW